MRRFKLTLTTMLAALLAMFAAVAPAEAATGPVRVGQTIVNSSGASAGVVAYTDYTYYWGKTGGGSCFVAKPVANAYTGIYYIKGTSTRVFKAPCPVGSGWK